MSQNDVSEEIKDLNGNLAISMLNDFQKQGKLSQEKCEEFKKKYILLHDAIIVSFKNQKELYAKNKKLKADLTYQKQQIDTAKIRDQDCRDQLEQLASQNKKLEQEFDHQEAKIEQRMHEYSDLDHEKSEKQNRIQKERQDAELKFKPEIVRFEHEIRIINEEIQKKEQTLLAETQHLQDINQKIIDYQQENNLILLEQEKIIEELSNIKGEPLRFAKSADIVAKANRDMNDELQSLQDDSLKKDKQIYELQIQVENKESLLADYDRIIQQEEDEIANCIQTVSKYKSQIKQKTEENEQKSSEKFRLDTELDNQKKEIKRLSDTINYFKKNYELTKKQYKKEEVVKQNSRNMIRELEMHIDKLQKEMLDLKRNQNKQEEQKINIDEEIKLLEGKKRNVTDKKIDKEQKKQQIEKQIAELEKEIIGLQNTEALAIKTVKNLTAMRESMARKASSAMAEVREQREQLKIKELLNLDLRKKQQETEFKLNNYKALYEEVKSARNKYVNMIQNSSQDLAELKEKIKILQNELEILKNESAERDRTLMEYKHILQKEIHKRDRRHTKLNKLEYIKKQKKELVDQNINEIEKFNMIILSLEKDMLYLRKQYEQACESRNYTGIQLIDRNDELCILYEKANIQDSILKNGEFEIKRLDDEIRMIKIEINETKRRIEVARKQLDNVPQLADRVISLKNELEIEKEKERKQAEELENPENENRWREQDGEDPEQEALEAKIQVLEERLNTKKEALLEKELILDEITNLSEKLRKQAIEGRQTTLELSEKVNEFQARLKEVTRKMMATISELSLFQASAIKLQNERDELENLLEEANSRVKQNLAPLPETEIDYLKMIRDKKRAQEERELRHQRELIEKNIPPFATKTTAEHRVNAYIPNIKNDIGIPKPYGKLAPFKPTENGANMRHYRKPVVKEIEI